MQLSFLLQFESPYQEREEGVLYCTGDYVKMKRENGLLYYQGTIHKLRHHRNGEGE